MEHSLAWRCRDSVDRFLSRGGGWLFAQSAILLALTRLALFTIPFQRLLHLSGGRSSSSSGRRRVEAATVQQIRRAVVRASRYVPGARHCLTQALVVRLLLARRGQSAQLRIGVAKDSDGRLIAHAWVECDGSAIFGAGFGARRIPPAAARSLLTHECDLRRVLPRRSACPRHAAERHGGSARAPRTRRRGNLARRSDRGRSPHALHDSAIAGRAPAVGFGGGKVRPHGRRENRQQEGADFLSRLAQDTGRPDRRRRADSGGLPALGRPGPRTPGGRLRVRSLGRPAAQAPMCARPDGRGPIIITRRTGFCVVGNQGSGGL